MKRPAIDHLHSYICCLFSPEFIKGKKINTSYVWSGALKSKSIQHIQQNSLSRLLHLLYMETIWEPQIPQNADVALLKYKCFFQAVQKSLVTDRIHIKLLSWYDESKFW